MLLISMSKEHQSSDSIMMSRCSRFRLFAVATFVARYSSAATNAIASGGSPAPSKKTKAKVADKNAPKGAKAMKAWLQKKET